MNTPVKYILLILFLTTATAKFTQAQEFGGNPPSLKWKQINTPAAKVIFPAGMDSAGRIVANIVSQMNGAIKPTIGFKQRQVSILLQNQTTIANGYVGLAPFRSEFYLTPQQNSFDIGSLPWPEQLAIHEFRHVQQYNNFDVGLSKALRTLFGEGGQALGNELSVPNWFFEGDAVFNETHVSEQGRGRLPYFFNGFRALWADGRDYSYMKIRNGSYIDYTPDWYPLGYMMVSYGREKYGDDFWKKVTHDAAAFKGGIYPFQRAIKKYSGVSFEQFRQDALTHFKRQFAADKSLNHSITQSKIHFDADREYPAYVNDSTLIYMKSTYDQNPAFVMWTGNTERKISTRSYSLDNYFDYNDGKIIYASYRPDLRWNYRDYSELIVLDVNTGKEHRITNKAKYFSPAFSSDGKTIVAVKVGPSGKSELHLLNATDGHLQHIIPNKGNLFFTYPKFYEGKIVSAVRNNEGKMSIGIIDIKTGRVTFLLTPSYQPIGFLNVTQNNIVFSATSGIYDKLFAINTNTKKLYAIQGDGTQKAIGAYEPVLSGNKITWVGFTAFGYQIHQTAIDSTRWVALGTNSLPGGLPDFNISALKRDKSTNLLARVVDSSLKITKYSKSYHLFNFHSLIPSIDDPNYTLSLSGENVLNTFQSDLSITYNRDEGYKQFGFDGIYGALFPYLYGGVNYTLDRRAYYHGENVYWNETNVHAGLELPLNFTEGKHSTFLAIGSDINYSNTHFQSAYSKMFDNQAYTYLNSYISFSNSNQQARQNIYPTLGERITLNYKNAISGLNSSQFLAEGTFYLPGLITNHSLVITAAHQQKGNGDNVIDFSNSFPFARGFTAENLYQLNGGSVNYALPLAYPDAGIANTIYFQRIRANGFFDYTHATDFYNDGTKFKGEFKSTGLEIFFDTKWFNQDSISFGFRYSHLLDDDIFGGTGRNRFEIIVPVSIF